MYVLRCLIGHLGGWLCIEVLNWSFRWLCIEVPNDNLGGWLCIEVVGHLDE